MYPAIQLHLALMIKKHGTIPPFLILWFVIKHSDGLLVYISTVHDVCFLFLASTTVTINWADVKS